MEKSITKKLLKNSKKDVPIDCKCQVHRANQEETIKERPQKIQEYRSKAAAMLKFADDLEKRDKAPGGQDIINCIGHGEGCPCYDAKKK